MKTDKEKIDELIDYEKSYTRFQLFITGLFYYRGTFANKQYSYYKLWTKSYWSGPYIAVFTINFDSKGMVTKIDVEKSPSAKILNALFSILFGTVLILPFIQTTLEFILNNPLYFLGLFAIAVILLILGRSVILKIYLHEARYQLQELKIALGHETEEFISQKQRNSAKRTPLNLLLRILIYTLLLSAIALTLYNAKEFPKGLYITLICGTYLFADLTILFRK